MFNGLPRRAAPIAAAFVMGTLACGDSPPVAPDPAPVILAESGPGDAAAAEIVFVSNQSGNFDIFKMAADGSGVVQLTDDPRNDYRPAWSPDGNKIAWSRQAPTGDFAIWVMNADGSGQHELNPVSGGCPAWSPDGTRIAFWSGPSYGEVMIINADGSNLTNLTNTPVYEGCPTWSPDGSRLVFPAQAGGPNWQNDLHTMKPDGSDRRLLLAQPGSEANPVWSPDGSKILFANNSAAGPGQGGKNGLFVVNADGTGLVRLANFNGDESVADWSGDGTGIVFTRFVSDWDVFRMDARGGSLTPLTSNHKIFEGQPNWR